VTDHNSDVAQKVFPTRALQLWRLALTAAPVLLAGFAVPASADWLLTREGARIETRGGWEIKGKMVVFTLGNGTLSSLRLAEVDLEASRKATEAAKAPRPAAPPAAPKKPVLVLTDADVGHVTRPPGGAPAESAQGGEAAGLEVVSWTQVEQAEGSDVQIMGSLRNNSTSLATDLTVMVRLFDSDQALVAETPAILSPNTLAPGAQTTFRALFPGVASFVTVTFEPEGNLEARTFAPPPPAGESR
jgi:hypothetical protein